MPDGSFSRAAHGALQRTLAILISAASLSAALFLCGVLFICGVLCAARVEAEADLRAEYTLKAAFVANFLKYIELPSPPTKIVLCLIKNPLVEEVFEPLGLSSKIGVTVVALDPNTSLQRCHVLFVPRSTTVRVAKLLADASIGSLLSIGEQEDFLKSGGIINLFMIDQRVRFEINVDAADRAGLKISSKLLQLAKIYRE